MGNSIKPHLDNASKTGVCNLSKQGFTEFPEGVLKLSGMLRTLTLYDNNILSLPPAIGTFQHLKMLNISSNRLTSLPPEIGLLSKLENLYASYNNLTSLPDTFISLAALKEVQLAGNQMKVFPQQLCSLENLDVIDLSHNKLTDIPACVKSLTVIEMNLNRNQISRMSDAIAECLRLKILRLEENCLELKSFPPKIFKHSQISLLVVDGNVFDEKAFRALEGYDSYQERFTAARKKQL